jgi:hypothetical protein
VDECTFEFVRAGAIDLEANAYPFDEVLMVDPDGAMWSWRRSEGGSILLYASIHHRATSSPEDWNIWTDEEEQPSLTAHVHLMFDTHAK